MHPEDLLSLEKWHGLLLAAQKELGSQRPFSSLVTIGEENHHSFKIVEHAARRSAGDAREMVWIWIRGPGSVADIQGSDHPAPLARLLSVNTLCMNLSGKSIS